MLHYWKQLPTPVPITFKSVLEGSGGFSLSFNTTPPYMRPVHYLNPHNRSTIGFPAFCFRGDSAQCSLLPEYILQLSCHFIVSISRTPFSTEIQLIHYESARFLSCFLQKRGTFLQYFTLFLLPSARSQQINTVRIRRFPNVRNVTIFQWHPSQPHLSMYAGKIQALYDGLMQQQYILHSTL